METECESNIERQTERVRERERTGEAPKLFLSPSVISSTAGRASQSEPGAAGVAFSMAGGGNGGGA